MKKAYCSKSILGSICIIFLVVVLTSCGIKGRAYVKEPDGSVGASIAGVNVTLTTDGGNYTRHATTGSNGNYKRSLKWSSFGISASHLAYQSFDSSPTTYSVPWIGYRTVNIPLERYDGTVIIVVRHAEKAAGSGNVNLIEDPDSIGIGLGRADELATITGSSSITATYATEWCRTAQTAQPSAQLFSLTMHIMDSPAPTAGLDNCTPPVDVSYQLLPPMILSSQDLAQHILANYAGQVVLVVGHSDTVPGIVQALSNTTDCPVPNVSNPCMIPGNEYHHMFVVYIPTSGTPSISHLTYGYVPQ